MMRLRGCSQICANALARQALMALNLKSLALCGDSITGIRHCVAPTI